MVLTACAIWVAHLISKHWGFEQLDPSDAATELVFAVSDPKHLLGNVAGPLIVLFLVTAAYIIFKNTFVRNWISSVFNRSFEILGEQLYHITALLIVFNIVKFITSGYYWVWAVSVGTFLLIEVFLITVFGGGRTGKNH